jgi:hypothetical protein
MEVVGAPHVDGKTIIVELRLNCNLHDLTIEQVTAKMRKVCDSSLPSHPNILCIMCYSCVSPRCRRFVGSFYVL